MLKKDLGNMCVKRRRGGNMRVKKDVWAHRKTRFVYTWL